MYNDGTTAVTFEIKMAAEKMISQVMIRNERFQEELEKGIENAINRFDFEEFVENITKAAIEDAIKTSGSWGKLRDVARTKADEVVDNYIKKQMENFKEDLENNRTEI